MKTILLARAPGEPPLPTDIAYEFTPLGSFAAAGQKLDYRIAKLRSAVRAALPWFLRGLV